jgi:hypothetical protein
MKRKNTDEKEILTRIANHLIINASFLSDLGLYHGKMGIVLDWFVRPRQIMNRLSASLTYAM